VRYDFIRRNSTVSSDATVLFHPTQRYDFADVINLCINGLKAVSRHFGETCTSYFGGSFQNFLKACNALQIALNKLIYNNFDTWIAA
jgi:hypothetical protein